MVPDSYYFKYENQPHNTAICTPSSIKQLPRQRFYKFSSDQLLPLQVTELPPYLLDYSRWVKYSGLTDIQEGTSKIINHMREG